MIIFCEQIRQGWTVGLGGREWRGWAWRTEVETASGGRKGKCCDGVGRGDGRQRVGVAGVWVAAIDDRNWGKGGQCGGWG